jgi:hypothetical protein
MNTHSNYYLAATKPFRHQQKRQGNDGDVLFCIEPFIHTAMVDMLHQLLKGILPN